MNFTVTQQDFFSFYKTSDIKKSITSPERYFGALNAYVFILSSITVAMLLKKAKHERRDIV